MGKTPVNTALGVVHGKIDDWVYREVEGETVIARRPRRTLREPTASQQDTRKRFREAAAYAKAVFADPIRKASYRTLAESRGVSNRRLFGFVVRDYTQPPVIDRIDVSKYARQPGNLIRVFAIDDAEVVSVKVQIKAQDGTVLEEDEAVMDGPYWRYEATTQIPPGSPVTVEAVATDRAANETTKAEVVP
jgi:hypothetical protein